MEKLIIDRKTWLHGEGSGNSYLLRKSDGKKCCLGFLTLSRGATPEQITQVQSPSKIRDLTNLVRGLIDYRKYDCSDPEYKDGKWKEIQSSATACELMDVNDKKTAGMDGDREEKIREEKIKKLFRAIDIDVTFVGDY